MGSIFEAILSWFLGLVFPKPNPATALAQDDGSARQALADVETANAHVTEAVQAAHAVELAASADPAGLRDPSPDSRD